MTYKVIITRAKNSNANLSSLSATEKAFNETFDKDTTEYTLTVDPYTKKLTLSYAPEVSTSRVSVSGNANFRIGENTITIRVTAEDGTTKNYYIKVTKEGSDINDLSTLSVSPGTLDPSFDENTTEYTVNVPNNVNRITVSGTKKDSLSTITGLGTYNLTTGQNTITVRVKSETGIPKDYIIKVNRDKNSDATLKTLAVSAGTLTPSFTSDNQNYTVNVDSTVDKIRITGTPTVSTTTVEGLGEFSLHTGVNTFDIITHAEDNTSLTYQIVVTKDMSNNANLSYLNVREGRLVPNFDPMTDHYTVKVPYTVEDVTVDYTAADPTASVILNKPASLEVGENNVTVTVTSEDGSVKPYYITVTRQEETDLNLDLTSLEVSSCTIDFDAGTTYYECEVEYDISSVLVKATASEGTTVTGTGTKVLSVGPNVLPVVVSKDGFEKTYQVVINRKQSAEARLNNIVVTNHNLTETFNPDDEVYHLTTKDSNLNITPIKKHEGQTVVISGNTNLTAGENTVTILVTSADGNNTKTYTLIVEKLKSDNKYLSSLSVENFNITPNFNKTRTDYTLEVGVDVVSVIVNATAEDPLSTVSGNGMHSLDKGENIITITVTAEDSTTKDYTLKVTRLGSKNNYLESLSVAGHTLTPEFNKTTNNYTIEDVEYSEDTINITAIAEDENATITGDGTRALMRGQNKITVVVTAEHGEVNMYHINVKRKDPITSKLENIKVKDYDLDPAFDPNTESYSVTVDNEVESLDLIITKLDPNSTYEIVGNSDFQVGLNTVKVISKASDNSSTTEYILNVNRQAYSNTYLSTLTVSEGELSPEFDKTNLTYNVDVPYDTESIIINASPEVGTATVTGIGEHNLSIGSNEFKVTVTSTNGIRRTYTVIVNRQANSNANILSITSTRGPVTKETDSRYKLVLPKGTTTLNASDLIVTLEDSSAIINMPDSFDLTSSLEYPIQVTSADGRLVKNYVVEVSFSKSNDATLKALNIVSPTGVALSPSFKSNIHTYTLDVLNNQAQVELEAIVNEADAHVLNESMIFDLTGDSTSIVISVQAEDGTIDTYTVNVNRVLTDEINPQDIIITGIDNICGDCIVPVFNETTYSYTTTVPYDVSSINFNVIKKHPSQKVTITKDNNAVTSYPLSVGVNTYVVKVESSTGNYSTYTYNIERLPSSNANIASISSKIGTISKTANNRYSLTVPKGTTTVTKEQIQIVLEDSMATITMPDSIDLTETLVYPIDVTSPNGLVTNNYYVDILFAKSNDATLKELYVVNPANRNLSPVFDPKTKSYTLEVLDTDTSVEFYATPNEQDAFIVNSSLTFNLPDYSTPVTITVQAEDGTIGTYTIGVSKSITTERYPRDIIITGVDEICSDCDIPEFAENTYEYHMIVPYEVDSVGFDVVKKHRNQIVTIKRDDVVVTSYPLSVGTNTYIVSVQNNIGDTTEYTYVIERKKSTNNYLKSLKLTSPEVEIEDFSKTKQEYTVSVPYEYENIQVEAIPEDVGNATVKIKGTTYLNEGNNDVSIKVVSGAGQVREYILHVLRVPEEDNLLQTLTVSSGSIYTLTPKFTPGITDYTLNVPSVISRIKVEGVAHDPHATVVGNNEYDLNVGLNQISIVVTSVGGQKRTYKLRVTRQTNQNAYIETLTVSNGTLNEVFQKENTLYHVDIPYNVNKLNLTIKTEDPSATHTIIGNENLTYGENDVKIKVTSADKSVSKTYKLIVNKSGEINNYLADLKVDGVLVPNFDKTTQQYTIDVENITSGVSITATPESNYAQVSGEGTYALNVGSNEIIVTVKAQDGTPRNYIVNINRKINAYLRDIQTDVGELTPAFDKATFNYTMEIEDASSITIKGIPDVANTLVGGNGVYNLDYGNNVIKLKTKNGTEEKEYTINVNRKGSMNTDLKYLTIGEGILSPEFDKDETNYTATIPDDIDELTLDYAPDDPTSTVEVIGNTNLEDKDTITIRVRSTGGATKDYKIKVNKDDAALFSNKLANLTTSNGTLSPKFDKDTSSYAITVSTSVSQITLTATPESSEATVVGDGTHTLNAGRNEFKITVTSKDNKQRIYTVVVYQVNKNDARLSKLKFSAGTLSPNFSKNSTSYTLKLPSDVEVLSITDIATVEEDATYVVDGLMLDKPNITITVTAPDGTTTKTYTVKVQRSKSTNAFLKELSTNVGTLEPEFSKETFSYTMSVDSDIHSINVTAVAESLKALVSGDGVYNLVDGKNYINILVTAESGTTSMYTIVVDKAKSNNAFLKTLMVKGHTLDKAFDKETNSYALEVEYEEDSVIIDAEAEDIQATLVGDGRRELVVGENRVQVVVTAADGTPNTYEIVITRKKQLSPYLSSLSAKEAAISPTFASELLEYTIDVPNEFESLTLEYVTVEDGATVEVIGNENLEVGVAKEIQIKVTSQSGATATYKIYATRLVSSNTYLASLNVDVGTLNPEFNKETQEYRVSVDNAVKSINISAIAEDENATVTGIGKKNLSTGDNEFIIKVTSGSGATRDYKLVVNRAKNNNTYLSTLVIDAGTLDPEFDKNTKTYTITPDEGQTEIVIIGLAEVPTSKVTGHGTYELHGGDNVINIVVTAEDGSVDTYTVTVKCPSSDATLSNIEIDKGTYIPNFDSDIHTYDVYTYVDDLELNITATPTVEGSTVTGDGLVEVKTNPQTVEINVTSPYGTTGKYTLIVHPVMVRDLYLENISLKGIESVNCEGYCSYEPTFDKETFNYNLTVPYEYDKLDLNIRKMNNQQVVKYYLDDVEFTTATDLSVGTHTVKVEVYDGLGNKTSTYNLNLERLKSDNNYLEHLYYNGREVPEFNREVIDYSFEVPFDTDNLNITYVKGDENATVTVNNTDLNVFNNDITVKVTSHLGNDRVYTLHVFRLPKDNNLLSSLTITGDVTYDYTPSFAKNIMSYSLTVPKDCENVTVAATVDEIGATLTGTGVKNLNVGLNQIDIVVTSKSGVDRTYTVFITRSADNSAYLKTLSISNGTLTETFNKGKLNYTVNVESNVDSLDMEAIPESDDATVTITGNANLRTGENTVQIKVVSFDNSAQNTYTLKVIKKGSNDATLSSITIDGKQIAGFDKDTHTYSIDVTNDKTAVDIGYTTTNKFASVSGAGVHALSEGLNTITLSVIAEDGTIDTYTLKITRNIRNVLSTIITSEGTLDPLFNELTTTYTVEVENSVTSIVLTGVKEEATQTVTGDGEKTLVLGENTFTITVSKEGAIDTVYTVNVIRKTNDSAYLKYLTVGEGKLSPTYKKTTLSYDIQIPSDINQLSLDYVKEDENATVLVTGNESLKSGDTVKIKVTSPGGATITYKINVTKSREEEYSNKLLTLSVDEGELSPGFDSETYLYTVNVDTKVSTVMIRATREDPFSTIKGTGEKNLTSSRNEFKVVVTSKDGIDRTYTIIVNKISTEARLSKLSFNEATFTPAFNKDTFEYNMSLSNDIAALTVKEITPIDSEATYEIKGLDLASDKIMVIVTAPDKSTKQTYTINLTNKLSGSSKLASLKVSTGTLTPTFNKNTYIYTVDVDSNVNSVNIEATPESLNATVTGDGLYNITSNKTTANIVVTAENGVYSTYTVIINRSKPSNAYLRDLFVRGYNITPTFDKETDTYTLEVESDVDKITIDGVKEAESQIVTGFGEVNLNEGLNECKVKVKAEDGSEFTYTINVTRKNVISSKLTSLKVKEGTLDPAFNKNTTTYTVTIPNEYDKATFEYVKEDENATVTITGNEDFKVGEVNVVKIKVKDSNGDTTTYTVNVTRSTYANTFLDSLEVVGYTLTPTFDKDTQEYKLDVSNNIDSVTINATANDPNATVNGTGEKSLELGENIFEVEVVSPTNINRIYKVIITRVTDTNNLLSSLEVENHSIIPTFDKDTLKYTLEVENEVEEVNVKATAESTNATVTGTGTHTLTTGVNNIYVTVTSQDGEINTYQIDITRKLNSNKNITSITPSIEIEGFEFDKDSNEYNLTVDGTVNTISFEVIPEVSTTTITGNEDIVLSNEENTFDITVTAEDGTTRLITFNIKKDYQIKEIEVEDEEITLFVGDTYAFAPTITPTEASAKEITYSTESEIIKVEEGIVMALEPGTATVRIASKEDENIYVDVTVIVKNSLITSQVYEVKTVEDDVRIVIGADEGVTIKDFVDNLDNNKEDLTFYDSEGNEITDDTTEVATSIKIVLKDDTRELDTAFIVVRGDTNGDGAINVTDDEEVSNHILGKVRITDYKIYAADIDIDPESTLDDMINVTDEEELSKYILGKITTLNKGGNV